MVVTKLVISPRVLGGDILDISDVLHDLGYDSMTDVLADWVNVTTNSNYSFVQISQTGDGLGFSDIVRVNNDNTLTLTDLVSDGNLITV